MPTLPRLLVIMGSGETAPTMKAPHRSVFERLAAATGGPVDAVLLDTPFGFQENAPILAEKTAEYFTDAVGRHVDIAGLGRTDTGNIVAIEQAIARIRAADWVFAGPGSPTFALEQWRGTPVPDALRDKLVSGGAVVFSSAAALTLGRLTVPVYEIYKVGADPHWVAGLDVLAAVGLDVVVIPHYDNKEGGNHDTSKCYLGERRLLMLEPELPDGVFVLGIDEHTGIIVDLDAETVEVVGKGALTLRRNGHSVRIESGEIVALDVVRAGGDDRSIVTSVVPAEVSTAAPPTTDGPSDAPSLRSDASRLEAAFAAALIARDADAAVGAILQLETSIVDWSRDTLQGDDLDHARTALRSMIVRLAAAATGGLRDTRDVLGPVVEAALAARVTARSEKAFAVSDAIRDNLAAVGIEVRDTADGVEWLVTGS